MSAIATVIENMATLIAAALPAYGRIANPYLPEQNDQLSLAAGYGIGIGPGRDPRLHLGGRISYERSFNVLLYNVLTAMPNDASGRAAQDLALIEDFRLVRRTLEQNQSLSGAASKVDYEGDTGVVLSTGQEGKFLSIAVNFTILYEESL